MSDKNCRQESKQSVCAHFQPAEGLFHFMILTRFPSVLRSSRSDAGVGRVQGARDTERPFLMDFGQRAKKLRSKKKKQMRLTENEICRSDHDPGP